MSIRLFLKRDCLQVTQLTGFSDPVYAEAYVNVNQYDIVLDVLIVNQTRDTLQNCTLELATLGDLKLVEKPQVIQQLNARIPKIIVDASARDFCEEKNKNKSSDSKDGGGWGGLSMSVYCPPPHTSNRRSVKNNPIITGLRKPRLDTFFTFT